MSLPDTVLRGLSLSPGVAFGRVCRLHEPVTAGPAVAADPAAERERLDSALSAVLEELEAEERRLAGRLAAAEASLLGTWRMLLEDPALHGTLRAQIERDGCSAEAAVSRGLSELRRHLAGAASAYLRERAGDIADLERRLLRRLQDARPWLSCADALHCLLGECRLGNDHVIVAEEITPAIALGLDLAHTVALVAAHGGPTSHAAILARALGVPAVAGIADAPERLAQAAHLLVDGQRGLVIVDPSPGTLARAAPARRGARLAGPSEPVPEVVVLANVDRAEDVAAARAERAEGVGLYRTEIDAIAAGGLHDEDAQYERYARVVEGMAGLPVTIRLLDAGADKLPPGIGLTPEPNPALGRRGVRLLLERPDLLRDQARAIARAAAHGPVRVLYPMVVSRARFLELRARFEAACAGLAPVELAHGVLFEVPAACLDAEALLEVADFGCVGTNDLQQYLFAADRTNAQVAADVDPESPALWRLLAMLARAAEAARRELTVCGELAAEPRFVGRLLEVGLRRLSVTPRAIAAVRAAARAAVSS